MSPDWYLGIAMAQENTTGNTTEGTTPSKEDPGESIKTIYKDVLKQAWIDGALTYDEVSLIDRIRNHLGINML